MQNSRHLADEIFKYIFLNEMYKLCIRFHRNVLVYWRIYVSLGLDELIQGHEIYMIF